MECGACARTYCIVYFTVICFVECDNSSIPLPLVCSIIAVSYEARACGVTRNMRGDEARKLCPTIKLASVPEAHGKADLTRCVSQ